MQENTNIAVNERVSKAKGIWKSIKKRVFLDKEIKPKIKLDLWNAAINSVMKYSMTTINKTQAADEKMQQFASKCLRSIVYGNNAINENEHRNTNYDLRVENNISTTHSQLIRDKICDIYRWKTSLSPSYLNNKEDCENMLNMWKKLWNRMRNIINKIKDENEINEEEKELYETFKKLVRKELWTKIKGIISENEPKNNISIYKYNDFKELAKLTLKFRTYYSEKQERKTDNDFICPTCGKIEHSKARLTIHRKNSNQCMNDYWEEMKAWKICENVGCGKLFKTYNDVEKHMKYHCGNDEPNPYDDNGNEGEIDRRTRYGAGIPKEDLYMFNGKIMYDHIRKKWCCLMCNFERCRYGWYQVFGHIASKHCYITNNNENRWNIPDEEKYIIEKL